MRRKSDKPFDVDAYARRVEAEYRRLRGKVEADDGDLLLILQAALRPFGTGRNYFIRRDGKGRYVH